MHVTKTFRDLHVDAALCDALEAQGITHPFAIQELTLPLALDGNDLIGQARTGTGKTLAFGLPLLQRIDPAKKVTQALVIAPTRELAQQVHEDLKVGSKLGITSISVYGGVPYEEQIEALTSGVHVVVGTPGRLLDHLNRGNLDLSNVTQLVLDEADEMLDMGFLPDVERLIEACQGDDRHTMLFSATMPTAIVKLARRYMDHPTFTRADHEQKNTAPLVTQHFFQVHRMDKPRILARILQSPNRGGVYVFVRTKHMADRLVGDLEALGTPAIPIHGDLRQTAREKNLDRFRSGKATVLVATEVAARGLDVTGVTHVVNYDCPDDEKMYLHRIGRTARAGEAGVAITFAEFNEADRLNVIRKAVGATESDVLQVFSTSPELTEMFDLPEERPWDALVKEQTNDGRGGRTGSRQSGDAGGERSGGKGSAGKGSRGKGSGAKGSGGKGSGGADRGKRGDDRPRRDSDGGSAAQKGRTGRTDGRPKNDRGSEGPSAGRDRSTQRSADRSGRDRDSSATTTLDRPSGDPSGAPERATTSRETSSDPGERVRTRSRTRSRSRDSSSAAERSGSERPRDQGSSERSATDTTGTADDRGSDDRSGSTAPKGSSGRTRARRGGGGNREQGSGNSGAQQRAQDEPGDGDTGSAKSGDKSGAKGGGNRGGRNRGGSGRDKSSGRKQGGTGQDSPPDPAEVLQQRGPEARGDGQPQPSRRVKVEHLP
ncbi:MAG: DEAD/DEAH box helicase [Nitriliruptor sp.]|nr:MAG: DEAD/DEAH box helicase [Nitriliruptor sp.]